MMRGGADRVEAGILQPLVEPPEFAQFRRRGELIDAALRRFDRQPAQEAGDRRPVSRLRFAVALRFGAVLDRLGENGRVALAYRHRAAFFESQRNRSHAIIGINRNALALEGLERAFILDVGAVVIDVSPAG